MFHTNPPCEAAGDLGPEVTHVQVTLDRKKSKQERLLNC